MSALGSTSGAVSEAVARAESELAAFWSSPDAAEGPAKVRASTLNYVILCAPQDAPAYREAAEKLSDSHGGRTLLLTMSGRIAAWDLVPEIHAVCRIDGAVPVCYDRVDLTFGAVAASRAGSVVRTLALAELPTVVEVGAGAPQPLVDAVAGKFDRLVVDSGKLSSSTLAALARTAPCPIADRGMVRTFAWRELVARFFDGSQGALADIRRVEVHRPRQHSSAACDPAALMFGWFASRLGWTFVGRGAARDARGELVDLVVGDDDREGVSSHQPTGVSVRCVLNGESLDCSLDRIDGSAAARWKMRGAINADREHALGFKDETWVLVKAIDSKEGDRVTRDVLLAAAQWEQAA
ncbi:MAG: glucose-6-phosphate dehydrogenase assembly protein OpcA [Polyangiaceae bacterium]|nr:glucose-6-phosphate dehydrogenase assembly protein OpcA [Polyangiaceae bacterium]